MVPSTHREASSLDRRFRALVEGSIQGVLIHRHFYPLFANQALAALFGYDSVAEILRLGNILRLFAPHEHARLRHYNAARLRGEAVPARYEVQGVRRDGQLLWLENLVTVVEWEGAPAVQATIIDITARKQAEEALAQHLRQLEAVRAVSLELTRELDLTRLLHRIVQHAVALVPAATTGAVYLWDEAAQRLQPHAWSGYGDWVRQLHQRLGEGLVGAVAQQRRGLLVNDYPASPYAHPVVLAHLAPTAALAEPLLYHDRLVGAIVLNNHGTTRPFTPEDQELLALFAAQAAVAIENARLFREAGEQQARLEALVAVNRRLTRGLELGAVLDTIVQAAARLFAGEAGFRLLQGEALVRVAATPGALPVMARERLRLGESLSGAVATSGRPFVTSDLTAEPRLIGEHRIAVDPERTGATLVVPVRTEQEVVGTLHVFRERGYRFTPQALQLATSLADQAAVAITNARLYGEALAQTARLEALLRTSARVASTPHLDELLACIAEEAARLLDVEGAGFRLLHEARLVIGGAWGIARHVMRQPALRVGESLSGWVAQQGQPLIVTDMRDTPLVLPEHREAALRYGVIAYLGVPLRYRDRLTGVLNVYSSKPRHFSEAERRLLGAFADQAAIAIEHLQLLAEAQAQAERLKQANAALEEEMAERRRTEALLAGQKRVLEMIVAERPLPEVLAEVVHLIEAQAPGLLGSVLLLDEDGQHLRHGAAPSLPEAYNRAVDGIAIGPQAGSCGTAAYRREAVIVSDIASDPLWAEFRHLALPHGLRACWSTPILGSHGQVLGTFACYYREPRAPTESELRLVELCTHLAGLAIERQREHEALRASEERYRELFESASDIVCTFDLSGRLTAVNAAAERLTGYRREEALGADLVQLLAPEDRERVLQALNSKLTGEASATTYELELQCKDGRRLPLEVCTQLLYRGGRPAAVLAIARDISERRRLETQLRQAQKMEAIGTLAGGIAHDFNNILAAIIGYAELALYEVDKDQPAARHLGEVLKAAQRAKRLVQQILAFSRQQQAERQPLQLHLLVKEALTLLRATLPATIRIETALATHDDTVLADATQLHQVLLNLCANAEYAMRPQGGTLEIRLAPVEVDAAFAAAHPPLAPGPHVRLTVRDTGCGMPPEVRERIFEPFFTTKGVGEGTGMGLAVVHGIVTAHEGAITVESTVGQGTRFDIYLPRLEQASHPQAAPLEASLPRGTEHVLFVDDELPLARLGQALLERLGYRVTVFTSSLEALAAFRAAPDAFDVLLTDQTMPELTGEALIQEVRRLRPELPVILCTGFSHTVDEDKARALGIDAFVLKPLVGQELARLLRQVLEGKRRAAP